jgi:HPt (histidine-containing phosphotransfer) domain-containing protein
MGGNLLPVILVMVTVPPIALGLGSTTEIKKMTTDQELQAKIAALRITFTESLTARFEELDAALAAIAPGLPLSGQSAQIQSVLEQTHKIAGSAGTFGFMDMSLIAAQAEQLCDRILQNRHGADETALRELQGKIADIRAELK